MTPVEDDGEGERGEGLVEVKRQDRTTRMGGSGMGRWRMKDRTAGGATRQQQGTESPTGLSGIRRRRRGGRFGMLPADKEQEEKEKTPNECVEFNRTRRRRRGGTQHINMKFITFHLQRVNGRKVIVYICIHFRALFIYSADFSK